MPDRVILGPWAGSRRGQWPGRGRGQWLSAGLVTFLVFVSGGPPSGTALSTTGPVWAGIAGRSTRPGAASLSTRNRSGPTVELTGLSSHFWRATAGRSVVPTVAVKPGVTLTSWMTAGGIRTGTGTGPAAPGLAAAPLPVASVVGTCTVRYRLLTWLRMYQNPLPASSKEKSCAAVPSPGSCHSGAPGAGLASFTPSICWEALNWKLYRRNGRNWVCRFLLLTTEDRSLAAAYRGPRYGGFALMNRRAIVRRIEVWSKCRSLRCLGCAGTGAASLPNTAPALTQ